jgi:DUF1365 family protein
MNGPQPPAALYHGIVTHRRLRPVSHALRYRIFMLLVDLEAPAAALPRLFGFDRGGVLSFHQRDHGDGTRHGLRAWAARLLAGVGLPPPAALRVLCMPRVFGHVFNPLSIFFCHADDGALQALIYEVNNTFGQRHAYVLPVAGGGDAVAQECAKTFHVSPFMDIDLRYRFRVRVPAETVSVVIHADDAAGLLLTAGFAGRAEVLTNAAILRAVARMPWLGVKVLGGIHWEAAKLWSKGLKLRPAPAPTGAGAG